MHYIQGASYFEQPRAVLPPPPKKPPPPVISVEAVKKATNPIALRYWNQCSNTSSGEETPVKVIHTNSSAEEKPPWVTSEPSSPPPVTSRPEEKPKLPPKKVSVPNIVGRMGRAGSTEPTGVSGPRQRVQSLDRSRLQPPTTHHDDPSPMGSPRTEVVKVLSTAGTGIQRDNEKKEALGNINRMFSMVKIKKDDAARVTSAKTRTSETEEKANANSSFEESRSYQQLKEEQIQKSQQRANFMGASEQIRIPKSPRPFRDSSPKARPEETQQCSCKKTEQQGKFTSTEIPFNTVTDLIPKLNQQQATHIGLSLFNQMSQDTVMQVLAQQLNIMSGPQMANVFGGLRNQVFLAVDMT